MNRFVILLLVCSTAARAQSGTPDPVKVDDISKAAEFCALTKEGVNWTAIGADRIKIVVATEADALAVIAKDAVRTCFFPWAYERHVTVEFALAGASTK